MSELLAELDELSEFEDEEEHCDFCGRVDCPRGQGVLTVFEEAWWKGVMGG